MLQIKRRHEKKEEQGVTLTLWARATGRAVLPGTELKNAVGEKKVYEETDNRIMLFELFAKI